jgi:hypothetical protein
MGLVGDGSDFDPFYGGLVRKGGPREKRIYRVALMGEYARNDDKPNLTKEEVHDHIERKRREIEPIIHPKIPEPNKRTIPVYVPPKSASRGNRLTTNAGNVLGSTMDNSMGLSINHANSMASSTKVLTAHELNALGLGTAASSVSFDDDAIGFEGAVRTVGVGGIPTPHHPGIHPGGIQTQTSTENKEDELEPYPSVYPIEPVVIKPNPDASDRDPFHAVRRNGPKEKRLYKTSMMGEFDYHKFPPKAKLTKDDVEEWVIRSGEENARKSRPPEEQPYDPFFNVRRNGPKEKRLYRVALMGEYDYHREVDNTELKESKVVRQPLTLEMAPMPGFEPFYGVRSGGPKEVRLYRRALMGEYDYRKPKDETVLERLRREKSDKFAPKY